MQATMLINNALPPNQQKKKEKAKNRKIARDCANKKD